MATESSATTLTAPLVGLDVLPPDPTPIVVPAVNLSPTPEPTVEPTPRPLPSAAEQRVSKAPDYHAALLVRGSIAALGLVGVYKLARSIRLFTQFKKSSQIPEEFIRKGFRLHGTLAQISTNGEMHVRHVPVATLRRRAGRDDLHPTKDTLPVRLAGLDLTEKGRSYMYKQYGRFETEPHVYFTLLNRSKDKEGMLQCEVHVKRLPFVPFLTYSVNQHLVRRGLARVRSTTDDEHLWTLRTMPPYSRLIDKLVLAEQVADRRGVGLWRRRTIYEAFQRYTPIAVDAVCNSSIYLASQITAERARSAYTMGRDVALRINNTSYKVATEHVPNAARKLSDVGHRNKDTFSAIGRTTGKVGYGVLKVIYYILLSIYKMLALMGRGWRAVRR